MSTTKIAQGRNTSSRDVASGIAAAASTKSDSSSPLKFQSKRLRHLCKKHLPWSDDDITLWITKHAVPYLKHWKITCYDDPVMRNTLHALLASPENKQATRQRILDLCINHDERLCSPLVFATLPAGPSKYVAKTATEIHLLSFSKVVDWAAAFALCENGGYEIAVELVVEVFSDLWRSGSTSWFHPLLQVGSSNHLGGQKRTFDAVWHDELEERHPQRARVDSQMEVQCHGKEEPPETVSKDRKKPSSKASTRSNDELQPNNRQSQAPKKTNDGQPLVRTRIRNERKWEKRKLKRFIAVGLLPPDATLSALRKRHEELEADREKGVERALAKAAEKTEREEAEHRRARLKVTLRFTGHRKDLLREILSTGRDEAKKRNELANKFPGYHGVEAQSEPAGEAVACLSDWDERMFRQAKERRGGGRGRNGEKEQDVVMSEAGKGDWVPGIGCERKAMGRKCVMCAAFGKA